MDEEGKRRPSGKAARSGADRSGLSAGSGGSTAPRDPAEAERAGTNPRAETDDAFPAAEDASDERPDAPAAPDEERGALGAPAEPSGRARSRRRRSIRLALNVSSARGWFRRTRGRYADNLRAFATERNPSLWLIALLVGASVGGAAVLFRYGIGAVQWAWFGEASEYVVSAIEARPWWLVILAPVTGGLLVGLLNQHVLTGRRPGSVADVMEAAARGGRGLTLRNGVWSALATVLSLGSGVSAGREGPVIHLGATLASALCKAWRLPAQATRIVLACGVASAISASFNAPIAGVLFAHEVILRHYAVSAFVPIVIASVCGSLAGRVFIGNVAAFQIPAYSLGSYWEMPIFALLGVVAAGVAIAFQFMLVLFDQTARAAVVPAWTRPVAGGLVIGIIGVFVPHALGVGYEATDTALHGGFDLLTLTTLLVVKILATALALASRFGGGIFSPSLYLGAMTGGGFGLVAAAVFPEIASDHGLYAILGMGAVASALLGAPISTAVIVFELTGGYALSIALLLTVSIATGLHLAVHGRSFFYYQLETRGVVMAEGPHRYFLKSVRVSSIMTQRNGAAASPRRAAQDTVRTTDTLETVLRIFNDRGVDLLYVVDPEDRQRVVGTVTHVQALRAYNRRLVAMSVEEHR